jgi:cell division protein ZapA
MNSLSIKIKIDNREYPIKVTPDDEQRLRQAGKEINAEIERFKAQFGIEDKQDILSMVLFKTYVERLEIQEKLNNSSQETQLKLEKLNSLLSSVI